MTRRKIEHFDPSKFYLLEVPDMGATPSWSLKYDNDRSTFNYYARRVEARKAAFPGKDVGGVDPLWCNDITLSADMLRPFSYFDCEAPRILSDYMRLDKDFDSVGYAYVMIVSKQWRDILEYLEPRKHQFFPHELRFKNAIYLEYFLFYHRGRVDAIDYQASGYLPDVTLDGKEQIWTVPVNWTPAQIVLKRAALEGCHYVHATGFGEHQLYSAAAAAMLQSRLPSRCYLTPIECN